MMRKTAILFLICAALAAAVLSLRHPRAGTPIGPTTHDKIQLQRSASYAPIPPPHGKDEKTRVAEGLTAADQEDLKTIENGLRHIENENVELRDRRARSGHAAMESFLKKWSPIEKTRTDIKAVFGKPQRESDTSLLYSFDTGNYAWNYQFEVRNGRVAELTRPLSE